MTATTPLDPRDRDESVAPGDDFFRHANGGWLATHPVPPEYGAYGAFHEVTERNQELLHRLLHEAADDPGAPGTPRAKVGDYFAAGIDEATIQVAGIEPLRPLLDRIDAVASAADVRALAPDLEKAAVGSFFGTGIEPDFEDAGVYLVYVMQGGLGLPERDYYLADDERSATVRTAYLAHVAAQLRNLGTPAGDADEAAAAIMAFERRLAEASLTKEQRRDPTQTLNRRTLAELDELMPSFGLASFIAEVGGTQPTVSVEAPDFLRALDAAIADTPVDTLRAYLRWHLVRTYASSLPKAFEDEAFGFYGRLLGGQREPKPRWKRVLDVATREIGELVAELYVEAAFPPSAKARCEHLVEHLLGAMGEAIRGNDWMTEPTKREALAKLEGFSYRIGYPDTWRDYSALETVRTSWVENRLRAARFEHARQFDRLGQPVDPDEWHMAAHMVNAYYHPLLNQIVFPAGILQPPFFWADGDDPVNFGGIGAVIGHEITHGFDDSGSRFDAHGNLREWWTPEDRAEFERRGEVVARQYEGVAVGDDHRVSGKLTLGENIADLGGLSVAYHGMREALHGEGREIDGLTPDQRFFLAYATIWRSAYTDAYLALMVRTDPHSPSPLRANIPCSNFAPFAAAFAIPEGSPMARPAEGRARIW